MKTQNITYTIILMGFLLILTTGCLSFSTVGSQVMSVDDVISVSQFDLDSEIIILRLESTYSKFRLDTADILRLKAEGVDDKVIKYMIETSLPSGRFAWEYRDSPMNHSNYNFNQSDENYENYYSMDGSEDGIYLNINPYDPQTDYPSLYRPNYGGIMLYDIRIFENNNFQKIIK